ncbi:MAG: hypothetical protein DMD26_19000 [Gemmatimonadetes bacterium]|nr:MAG: hypothetical protein DMD26_19000 [Gemmatimonadota bacterium]
MRQPVPLPLGALVGGERVSLPHAIEGASRPVRHPSIELTARIAIERAAGRIRRLPGDVRQLERLAVVERRVAAAMMNDDGMLRRHLVEVVDVERTLIRQLRVVEEIPVDPCTRGRRARLRAELVDDAGDTDELHLEGITHQHLVQQRRSAGVVVGVDEARHDRHPLRVESLRSSADETLDVGGLSNGDESSPLHRKRLRARQRGMHRVDPGVEDDEIGVRSRGGQGGRDAEPATRRQGAGRA